MANIITGIRVVCAAALLFCPTFSAWFFALYVLGGVSDVLDGLAARRRGKETPLGAQLDTLADVVFSGIVLIKVVRAVHIPTWITVWIVGIALLKCVNGLSGFVKYKRFVSEHTVMNRLCGVLLFAVTFYIRSFPRQPVSLLIVLTCAAATFAAIQEGRYIRSGKEIR